MRVDLGAQVRTRDGEDAGSVQRAIVDPSTNEVTHFVVSTGALFGRDVLVPREHLEAARRDGEVVRLDLTRDQLEGLPDYAPTDWVAPPVDWVAPIGYSFYPAGSYAWPVDSTAPDAVSASASLTEVPKGTKVFDRHGDEVGVVEDVRLDPTIGQLEGVVLRAGGMLQTLFGGGDTVEIPTRLVDRVDPAGVYLRADKEEIERATP